MSRTSFASLLPLNTHVPIPLEHVSYILRPPYEKSIHKGVNEMYAPVNVPPSDSEGFGFSEEEEVSTFHPGA